MRVQEGDLARFELKLPCLQCIQSIYVGVIALHVSRHHNQGNTVCSAMAPWCVLNRNSAYSSIRQNVVRETVIVHASEHMRIFHRWKATLRI
jgi:hypothetical protein